MTPVDYVSHELARFRAELAGLPVVERDQCNPHGIERPRQAVVDGER